MIRSFFKKKPTTKTRCERSYDAGYIEGSKAERDRIIVMIDKLIDSNCEVFTSLLRQVHNSLENHRPN